MHHFCPRANHKMGCFISASVVWGDDYNIEVRLNYDKLLRQGRDSTDVWDIDGDFEFLSHNESHSCARVELSGGWRTEL